MSLSTDRCGVSNKLIDLQQMSSGDLLCQNVSAMCLGTVEF